MGRVDTELSTVSFEDYMGGPSRSAAFRQVVLRVPEMLVAAKRYASAAVAAPLLLEWYVGLHEITLPSSGLHFPERPDQRTFHRSLGQLARAPGRAILYESKHRQDRGIGSHDPRRHHAHFAW